MTGLCCYMRTFNLSASNTRLEGYAETQGCHHNILEYVTSTDCREDMGISLSGDATTGIGCVVLRPYKAGFGCSGKRNIMVNLAVSESGYNNPEGFSATHFYNWINISGNTTTPEHNKVYGLTASECNGHLATFKDDARDNLVTVHLQRNNNYVSAQHLGNAIDNVLDMG